MPYTLYTTHTDKRGPSFFQALQNCICIASIALLMLEVSTPAFSPILFAEEIAQTLGKMWNCSFIFHKSQVHCPLEVLTSFQAIYSTSMCEGLSCSPKYRSCLFKSFFKKSRIFLASPYSVDYCMTLILCIMTNANLLINTGKVIYNHYFIQRSNNRTSSLHFLRFMRMSHNS